LLQGIGGGHFVQFTCASHRQALWKRFKKTSGRTLLLYDQFNANMICFMR
jgi:hypothetical protein